MKITGQFNSEGALVEFTAPLEVVLFGDSLRDKEDGFVLAVKDEYGDWVSPSMRTLGIKSKMQVEER